MNLETNKSIRCPHFQLRSEPLAQETQSGYLAVRHCLLTARMRQLLMPVPDAQPLVLRCTIHMAGSGDYSIVGPDLDAVTHMTCHVSRCDRSCTPSYKRNLEHFGIVDPHEDTVTCGDETSNQPEESASVPPCAC